MTLNYKRCRKKGCAKKAEKYGYCRDHQPVKSKVGEIKKSVSEEKREKLEKAPLNKDKVESVAGKKGAKPILKEEKKESRPKGKTKGKTQVNLENFYKSYFFKLGQVWGTLEKMTLNLFVGKES